MTKQQFLEKHSLTERDYHNLLKHENAKRNGQDMWEYYTLMVQYNINGGEKLSNFIRDNYNDFLETLKGGEKQ